MSRVRLTPAPDGPKKRRRGRNSRFRFLQRQREKKVEKAWTAPPVVILTERLRFDVSLPSDKDILWPQWAIDWSEELSDRNFSTCSH